MEESTISSANGSLVEFKRAKSAQPRRAGLSRWVEGAEERDEWKVWLWCLFLISMDM